MLDGDETASDASVPPEVLTVGYEGRTVEELVEVLKAHGVQVLVDVRLHAMSRRRGFSKRALAEALAGQGIEYLHEPQLGNPKDNRPAYREGSQVARRVFIRHVHAQGADAVARLTSVAASAPTALLCFERAANSCHRTEVANELGFAVVSL